MYLLILSPILVPLRKTALYTYTHLPYVQLHPTCTKNTLQDAGQIGQGDSFGREKRHQNTRRSRATAPAGLEPPEGQEFKS